MRGLAVLLMVAVCAPTAHADDSLQNWLIGPVLGVRLDGPPGSHLVVGIEGGVGYGPERLNVGFEHRDRDLVYVELDPWYIVGGTLGVAVETDTGKSHPVLGLWEGVPLDDGPCYAWDTQVTLAGGYRYTGVHELYVTVKAGKMNGFPCWGAN